MFQSAFFADLKINNFGIPTVRFATPVTLLRWAKGSFAQMLNSCDDSREPAALQRLSAHLRRDIGLRV